MLERFAKNETGSMAVETALVMSFVLVPMVLGLWDVAQIGLGQTQVQEALQDAVTYVAAGNSSNTSGIISAAQSAYGTRSRYRRTRSAIACKPGRSRCRRLSPAAPAVAAAAATSSSS
jgi:Flp pilus assembly protein TadG